MMGKMVNVPNDDEGTNNIEKKIKDLGLINFSADENLSPELIDDVIESTTAFYDHLDIAGIAERIKKNATVRHG
jgi:hypothetical protein